MRHRRGRITWALFVAVSIVTVASSVAAGPADVAPNARCALCRMRIADRRYLAQLQTEDGAVMNFDDPGCLFRVLIERRPRVHARWFMGPGGRWLAGRDVAFAEVADTPMGYGLAAVRRGTTGAVSWDEAWRRAERRAARERAARAVR